MQKFQEELNKLKENSCFRSIKNVDSKFSKYIVVEGNKMLNLSSNDYLNLSTNDDLKCEFLDRYKNNNEFLFSSASARLLTGTSKSYNLLEKKLAKLLKKDAGLIFNTGYQCNQGVISTLFKKGDLILSDKLNHASIVSGLKLSAAQHFRYKHCNYNHLEQILKEERNKYNTAVIISESVYSMDGDIADVKKLIELKKKYNCLLMLDEAHAFGVFGNNLMGVADELELLDEIDIITLTFGKALGSMGAICLSNQTIIDYLINKASSFIFSTALPSLNILWNNFLLNEKFDFLREKKEKLNTLFKKVHNFYPSVSSSQIIPIIIKDSEETKKRALTLQKKGFYVLPINPPTVPFGTSRLRISLTSDMEFDEIKEVFCEI